MIKFFYEKFEKKFVQTLKNFEKVQNKRKALISWKRGNLSLLETFVWVLSQKFNGKYLNLEIQKLTKSEEFEKYEQFQSGWKVLLCLKSYSLGWIETIRMVFWVKSFRKKR